MSAGPTDRGSDERPLRRDAERNRQRILAAAREVFAERGLTATLDDVAQHAGLGVGTVYRRFTDKGRLVEALFEDRIDELVALADAAMTERDSWAGFVGFLERSCALLAADHGLRDVVLGKTTEGARISQARERLAPAVRQLLHRAQEDGYVRPDLRQVDVPIIDLMIGSVVDYTNSLQPEAWRRYLALIIDGLRAREGGAALPEALDEVQLDEAMRIWSSKRS